MREVERLMSFLESIHDVAPDVVRAIAEAADAIFGDGVKELIIMRGLPGSGKSTKAKRLGAGGEVLSTDDFPGLYDYSTSPPHYDTEKTSDSHRWNQERAEDAMRRGVTPIVIDNTNVELWEPRTYVELAELYGYTLRIEESDTEWKNDVDVLYEKNTHGVPKEIIQSMRDNWDDTESFTKDNILQSKAPWEQEDQL